LGKPIQFCRMKLNCLALLCVEGDLCARRRQTLYCGSQSAVCVVLFVRNALTVVVHEKTQRFIVEITIGGQACFLGSVERCRFVRNTLCAVVPVTLCGICCVLCVFVSWRLVCLSR
jgi:hypothetical protein